MVLVKRRGKFRFLISRLKAVASLIGDSLFAMTCIIEVPKAYRSMASGLPQFEENFGGM
jgi:hypothetical protein